MSRRLGARTPLVSIVVVVYGGGWHWLEEALAALRRETREPYELIVVDNDPSERAPAGFRRWLGAGTLIRNAEHVGYGTACNQGAASARAPVICFLNPDVFVRPGWLAPLLQTLEEESGVGAVVPQKLNVDGTLQEAGAYVDCRAHTCVFGFGDDPRLPEHRFRREIDFGSGACVCIRRETFEQLDGFDPVYRPVYFEDADLCFRLRERGLATVYEPRSQVVHVRTTSVPLEEALRAGERNRPIFFERWKAELAGRPTCAQVAEDPLYALAARDLHTSERLLVLDSPLEARRLGLSQPRARVTLAVREPLDSVEREALLRAGIEVVEKPDRPAWLESRRGHYSLVLGDGAGPSAVVAPITRSAPRLLEPRR